MGTKNKVFIVQEVLAQFRIPLFNLLNNEIDLEVLTSYPTKKKNRIISETNNIKFKHVLFKNIDLFGGIITFHPKLLRYLKKYLPDTVILEPRLGFLTTMFIAVFYGKSFKIVWWLSGYESSKSSLIRHIKRLCIKFILKKGDGYLVYSNAGVKYLNQLGIRDNIYIAYNSVDTNAVEEAKDAFLKNNKDKREVKSGLQLLDTFTIISTGRITKNKNYNLLVEAVYNIIMKYNININYVCIGDGTELNNLKNLVSKYEISGNVKFLGNITDESILSKYFHAADIFVLPRLGGLAINHALAYGKPIIVSKADGTEKDQVIENINGLYFEKNNIQSLISKIKYFIDNPEICVEMGINSARLSREVYNINSMKNIFLKVI